MARLYVFSDRYNHEPLRMQVLYKLRRTLAAFKLFLERVSDVFMLVMYVYENTCEGDDLRDLLAEYTVCMITMLLDHPGWETLIRAQPSFLAEVCGKMRMLQ